MMFFVKYWQIYSIYFFYPGLYYLKDVNRFELETKAEWSKTSRQVKTIWFHSISDVQLRPEFSVQTSSKIKNFRQSYICSWEYK